MAKVDDELRQKILDKIATGATPQECSERYGIPAGTIRSWAFRAKAKGQKSQRNAATQQKNENNATQRKNATTKKMKYEIKEPIIKLEDVDEDLTDKQRLFCLIYIRNFNATQAALKAGYSPNCAAETGYELLRNPHPTAANPLRDSPT